MMNNEMWITQAEDNVRAASAALAEVSPRADLEEARRQLARAQQLLSEAMTELLEVD